MEARIAPFIVVRRIASQHSLTVIIAVPIIKQIRLNSTRLDSHPRGRHDMSYDVMRCDVVIDEMVRG